MGGRIGFSTGRANTSTTQNEREGEGNDSKGERKRKNGSREKRKGGPEKGPRKEGGRPNQVFPELLSESAVVFRRDGADSTPSFSFLILIFYQTLSFLHKEGKFGAKDLRTVHEEMSQDSHPQTDSDAAERHKTHYDSLFSTFILKRKKRREKEDGRREKKKERERGEERGRRERRRVSLSSLSQARVSLLLYEL